MDVLTHSILPFAGILLGLVVIHEAAHYVTAKWLGVKVLEAGIGLPPRVFGFRWRETDYTLNLLPLGAFVRLLGEEDPTDPHSLAAQPKWKRTIIIGSGAVTNIIAAVALFAAALMIPHPVAIGGAKIADVAPGSPAQAAGLKADDQITKVNGRKVESTGDASYLLRLGQGTDIDLTIARPNPAVRGDSDVINKTVYSRWNPGSYTDDCGIEHSQGPIGIIIAPVHATQVDYNPGERARLETQARKDFAGYKKKVAPGAPAKCLLGSAFGFTAVSAGVCGDLAGDQQASARALRNELFPQSADPCYKFDPPRPFEVQRENRWETPWAAIPHGTRQAFETVILTRNQIWGLLRGFSGASPVTGPVGIAQATGEVVHEAGWKPLVVLAASISMSLGLLNLLPLPMLDGGRLFFIALEVARRGKRVAPEKEALVHFAGLVAMLMLFVVITFFDIQRIVTGGSLLR